MLRASTIYGQALGLSCQPDPKGGGSDGSGGGYELVGSWQTVVVIEVPGDLQTWTTTWRFDPAGTCRRTVVTESLADIAVYIISGASEVASLTSGQGLERIDGFFEKPLNLPKLLDTVSAVVRPSRRAPAVP